MPPKLLFDLDSIDLDHVEAGPEQIRKYNPQRFEMEQLEGVIFYDPQQQVAVGYKDVRDDEFWVKGHIPGRPLLPGVLICEAAAQLCGYYYKRKTGTDKFLGFGGMDAVKFRATVVPGDRLILIVKSKELKSRRATFDAQGVVNGKIVYQGVITGMVM